MDNPFVFITIYSMIVALAGTIVFPRRARRIARWLIIGLILFFILCMALVIGSPMG